MHRIRALFAGLLKGFSTEKSYALAEFVALNDLLPIVRPADQICKMLPSSVQHNVQLGALDTEVVATDRNVVALLNAPFIPVLATHFLGRDAIVRKVPVYDCLLQLLSSLTSMWFSRPRLR